MGNVTAPSTCKEHSGTGTGGPVTAQQPVPHIEGTLIWGKDNAPELLLLQNNTKPELLLLQNNTKPKPSPSAAGGPRG